MLGASTRSPLAQRRSNVAWIALPAGFPHQLVQSIQIAAVECGPSTPTRPRRERARPASLVDRTLPCQRIRTFGRPAGNAHATPLVFLSVTAPSSVPTAPFNPPAPESCEERQSGALARGAPPVLPFSPKPPTSE